jgi:AcrR family transcriptional regulator
MPAARARAHPKQQRRTRVRLAPEVRRQQIIDVAAQILTAEGAAGIQIKEVAKLARVTRPVVYRFFPTRLELIQGVLDDFEAELSRRYQRALQTSMGGTLPQIVEAFIEASCEAIEAKGKGAWRLMHARGPDLEASRLGRAVQHRLLEPWLPGVAQLTRLTHKRVSLLAEIVVAAGVAALDGWLDGTLQRKEAVRSASRAVSALLAEFSSTSKP